ncbi:phage GP46 family protein [Moritella viscosa]
MIRQLPQSVHVDIQHSDDSDPIVELVLLSLFTDARANDNDTLPDSSACCRGFIGDAFTMGTQHAL